MPKELVNAVLGGWDAHSGILEDLLAGRPPRSFWSEHDKAEKAYVAQTA